MAINKIKTGSIQDGTVTADDIQDGAITNAKVNACAAITQSKVSGLTTSISNLCSSISSVSSSIGQQANNIGLLGFKMAVNDGLTVFNLVDGVVDEFNDESGTDEAEGSNDYYCGTEDWYTNNSTVVCLSAGFTTTSITEPETSTAGTNPSLGSGTFGTYTVPCGITSINAFLYGSAGEENSEPGGGGGYTEGTIAVTGGQVLEIVVGEGGGQPTYALGGGALGGVLAGGGGGASAIITNDEGFAALQNNAPKAPQVFLVGAGGGGGGHSSVSDAGGAGGGLTGCAGGTQTEQTSAFNPGVGPTFACGGGGGGQGQAGTPATSPLGAPSPGGFLKGSSGAFNPQGHGGGGGGGGFYGGGGGARQSPGYPGGGAGGGGSSYYGHPQITSGSTEEGAVNESGGVLTSNYVACTSEGNAEDGYVLITASSTSFGGPGGGSTTITSETFTSGTVPTSSRIVVFEENVDTPTLNTDIIASISRDGTTFTNATLSDSGYVTGSSGQRILTGQADISGQPSGQSMRWKLALANNTVKIHGVSLQWS